MFLLKAAGALGASSVLFAFGTGAFANPTPVRAGASATHALQHSARRPHDSGTCSGTGSNAFLGAGQMNSAFGLDTGAVAGASNVACDDYSVVVGGSQNVISTLGSDLAQYSFIGAGQSNSVTNQGSIVGAGFGNQLSAADAAIVAGTDNVVSGNGSFVGSGFENTIQSSQNAFIGGGTTNHIEAANVVTAADAAGTYGAIGGGYTNEIFGNADNQAMYATIGGGNLNKVEASYGAIGGGNTNSVSGLDAYIGGGNNNVAAGNGAVVGGGGHNTASGIESTVAGGFANIAQGNTSFAAGYIAEALTNGSFVWSDQGSSSVHVKSTVPNEFVARASGGVFFYSNPAMTSGVRLVAGSGTWSSLSDRHMKTGIVPIDGARILDKVAALPVSEWSYTSERGVRHIGPMAQDFYAAFGVGEDDRHITTIDEDGVALAAVKALHAENEATHLENASLHSETRTLRDRNAALAARVSALERAVEKLTRGASH